MAIKIKLLHLIKEWNVNFCHISYQNYEQSQQKLENFLEIRVGTLKIKTLKNVPENQYFVIFDMKIKNMYF